MPESGIVPSNTSEEIKLDQKELAELKSLRKKFPLDSLPIAIDKKYDVFIKQFNDLIDALLPTESSGFFSRYCTNEKFKILLKERLALVKAPHELKWQELKTSARTLRQLWFQMIKANKNGALSDTDYHHRQLKKLQQIKENILTLLKELGDLNDYRLHTHQSLVDLRDLINQAIGACKSQNLYTDDLQYKVVIWAEQEEEKNYFSYNYERQCVYSTVMQKKEIYNYPQTVQQLKEKCESSQRVNLAGRPMAKVVRGIQNDLAQLEQRSPRILEDCVTEMPQAIKAVVSQIEKKFQKTIDSVDALPDLMPLSNSIQEIGELLKKIETIQKVLPALIELGQPTLITKDIEKIKKHEERIEALKIQILGSQFPNNFSKVEGSLHNAIVELKDELIGFYGDTEGGRVAQEELNRKGTALQLERDKYELLLQQYIQQDEVYCKSLDNQLDYEAMIKRAAEIQDERQFAEDCHRAQAEITKVSALLKEIDFDLRKIRVQPDHWQETLTALNQKARLGLPEDELFDQTDRAISQLCEDERSKQNAIDYKRIEANKTLETIRLAYIKMESSYASNPERYKILLPIQESYLLLKKQCDGLDKVRFDTSFINIQSNLKEELETLKVQAIQQRRIFEEKARRRKKMVSSLKTLILDRTFWQNKVTQHLGLGGVALPDKTKISHSVAALRIFMTPRSPTNDASCLLSLKREAEKFRSLPNKNWAYKQKYRFFSRHDHVQQLIDTLCDIDVENPDENKILGGHFSNYFRSRI